MSIANHFKLLGAPLKNTRWSWGAMREDGTAVLRVWQHRFNGKRVHIFHHGDTGPGANERLEHIAKAKGFYCVVCVHKAIIGKHIDLYDTNEPRIASYDKREVWYGTEVETDDQGNIWLVLNHRVAIGELI